MVVVGPTCGLHEDLPIPVLSAQQQVARVITLESSGSDLKGKAMSPPDSDIETGWRLATVLAGLPFPARTWQLVAQAEYYGADWITRAELGRLPAGEYPNLPAVLSAIHAQPRRHASANRRSAHPGNDANQRGVRAEKPPMLPPPGRVLTRTPGFSVRGR